MFLLCLGLPYSYKGCFRDSSSRLLSKYVVHLWYNSPEECVAVCRQAGFLYAGVESEDECFCGNTQPSDQYRVGENECNKKCPGSSTEKCGDIGL